MKINTTILFALIIYSVFLFASEEPIAPKRNRAKDAAMCLPVWKHKEASMAHQQRIQRYEDQKKRRQARGESLRDSSTQTNEQSKQINECMTKKDPREEDAESVTVSSDDSWDYEYVGPNLGVSTKGTEPKNKDDESQKQDDSEEEKTAGYAKNNSNEKDARERETPAGYVVIVDDSDSERGKHGESSLLRRTTDGIDILKDSLPQRKVATEHPLSSAIEQKSQVNRIEKLELKREAEGLTTAEAKEYFKLLNPVGSES